MASEIPYEDDPRRLPDRVSELQKEARFYFVILLVPIGSKAWVLPSRNFVRLRTKPTIYDCDILSVLKSLQNSKEEEVWRGIDSREIKKSPATLGYTECFLSKDHLRVGDIVRSRKPANSFKHENMDGVKVHGVHDPLRVHISVLEPVTNGLASGDWVRLKDGEDKRRSLVGIIQYPISS